MGNRRTPWRHLLALLLVGALVLGACSSDGGGDDTAPDDAGAEEASDVDPTGVIRIAYDTEQSGVQIDVDPLNAQADSSNNDGLWYMVHGRLLRPTLLQEGEDFVITGDTEGELAESVEIVDPSTIEVQLKEGLTFSDGSTLDAEAVKASYDAALDNQANNELGFLPDFYDLQEIEVTSPTSLTLSFAEGTAPAWYDQYAASWATSVVKLTPEGTWDSTVTSGPFTIADRTLGENWTLEKNANYWNADNVEYAGVELESVRVNQAQAALAALQSGQVDVTFTEPSLLPTFSGNVGEVVRVSPNVASMLHICKAEDPLADARVRRAINMAMDRDAISEAVYYGTATAMHQSWPEGHRFNDPDLEEVLAYDPDGARQLLEQAGYGDGVSIDIYPIQAFNLDEVAEVMADQLAEVGVNLNIVPTPDYVGQYLDTNARALGVYPSTVPGPQKLVSWSGDSQGNVCSYQNDEVDALVEQLSAVSESSDEAVELWHELSDIVVNEALSGFVVFRSDLAAYDTSRIGDMQPFPDGNYIVPDPWVSYVKAGS